MTTTTQAEPMRVMLVEDHALVRSAIRQTLTSRGIEVVAEASSAEEALTLKETGKKANTPADPVIDQQSKVGAVSY